MLMTRDLSLSTISFPFFDLDAPPQQQTAAAIQPARLSIGVFAGITPCGWAGLLLSVRTLVFECCPNVV